MFYEVFADVEEQHLFYKQRKKRKERKKCFFEIFYLFF